MIRIIDKILIEAFSIYAMVKLLPDRYMVWCAYVLIAILALDSFLLYDIDNFKHEERQVLFTRMSYVLQYIFIISTIIWPRLIYMLPVLMYDAEVSKNWGAYGGAVVSLAVAFASLDFAPVMFILILSFAGFMLAKKTSREIRQDYQLKRMRDDDHEVQLRLQKQNDELLVARDNEVLMAQANERNRIAREIHDNVGHMLSRAILQMGALLAIHKEEPTHTQLEELRKTLDTTMNNIRTSVHDLHDESVNLQDSVHQIVASLKDEYQTNLNMDISEDAPRDVRYAFIAILRECAANIIKHSENTNVNITVMEHPSMYQLIVHDFTPSSREDSLNELVEQEKMARVRANDAKESGIGLENIRSRVEKLQGTLDISTKDGYRVFVSVPKVKK